jgi:uncharacterized protein YlxW (UPF0749 family)
LFSLCPVDPLRGASAFAGPILSGARSVTTLEGIGQGIQQAYEHLKQPCHVETRTVSAILDALTQIQNSVNTLEAKYHDIETTIANTLKTYADIIKKSTPPKDTKIEQRTQKRKQREALREERAKYGVTLSTKDTSSSVLQQSIKSMSAKAIAERCQQAINPVYVNNADRSRIIGVSKLARSTHL